MDERYLKVCKVPTERLSPISAGRLKGKSDINPQWKISAMTETYGLCGEGWKFEIVDKQTVPTPTNETMIYMTVAVYVKNGENWSEPIYGCGGDFLIKKEKNGLYCNDEAYKMCLTDALGNALKCIGVAADVYEKLQETKYAERPTAVTKSADEIHNDYVNRYIELMNNHGIDPVKFIKAYVPNCTNPNNAPDEALVNVLNNPNDAVSWYKNLENTNQKPNG
jgi:hypothetical protein